MTLAVLDVVCWDDLDELGTEITDPIESLKQDNFHRLITPPGQNIDDPDFGLGLPMMLSGSDAELVSLGPRIEAELRKDRRNGEVRAVITPLGDEEYDIAIEIVPDADELGTVESLVIMNLRASGSEVELVA